MVLKLKQIRINKHLFWKNTERYNNKVFEQAKEIYCNAIRNEVIPKLKDKIDGEITIDDLQNLEVSLETQIEDLNDEISNTEDVKKKSITHKKLS